MRTRFRNRNGFYRRDGRLRPPGAAAHVWPFSRALVATLDVAGIGQGLTGVGDAEAIEECLAQLERYWNPSGNPPAYASDVRGTRIGGDRYYDDNAWIGLALVQLERMHPGSGHLDRAEELFCFAVSGWDRSAVPNPGGVFWVEQGRGLGLKNHDRNTVSTAPNAELGLHLRELRGRTAAAHGAIGADEMYDWVVRTLDASRGTDSPGTGLFWDKVRGDGTLDKTLWAYNQGSMVGANVLLARIHHEMRDEYLDRAEAIARTALRHFDEEGYDRQPPAFNAIFFRNLLLIHPVTRDAKLAADIINHIRRYADDAWCRKRDRHDRFHLSHGGVTLLNQSAFVQSLALLAWDPSEYGKLA
jgi:glycosyl hydrolase family 76